MMNRILIACGIIFLFGHQLMAQTVTGNVTDGSTGDGLPGVNIIVKGTTTGTSTDNSGNYQIEVPSLSDTLVFSFIGYETLEVLVNGRTTVDVIMYPRAIEGEEMVVVGYGVVSKKEVTGSVSTVDAEDFNEGGVSNPIGLIQGKVPGLNIITSQGSNPNGGYQIRLRGLNSLSGGKSPLIIVDGIVWTNGLETIDPNSIRSIDVLKDGSAAAIYGTRATNGVILISTKSPAAGKINFEFTSSLSTEVGTDETRYLSPEEYRQVIQDYYPDRVDGLVAGNTTDWMDQVTRNPVNQNYSIAASGGSEDLAFRANLYFENDQGRVLQTSAKTVTPSVHINQKGFNNRLEIDYRLRYSFIDRDRANEGVISQALHRNPTEPVYDPGDTEHNGYFTLGSDGYLNPIAMINEQVNTREEKHFTGDISASYQIQEGLSVKLHGSYNSMQNYSGFYQTRYYPEVGTDGNATVSTEDRFDILFEPGIEYITAFKGHSIRAIAGYSYFRNEYKNLQANNYNFDVDNFSYHNIGAGYALDDGLASLGSHKSTNKLISYYARTIYNYQEKYLASASVRYEGSTRFGANNKWGLFPAIGIGWRITEESFSNNLSWLSNLKIRAGYGVTGNQDIPNYQSLELIQISNREAYYDGRWINTYQPASNPNPDLKWEKKGELNVGLDFGLFDDRIEGSFDYYNRRISDLLWWYDVPVPPNVYSQTYANVGDMENKGVEFAINWQTIRDQNFSWSNSLNYARNRNKVISFSDPSRGFELEELRINPAAGTWTQLLLEGEPVGNFVAPVYLGTDENGNAIYKDVNGDGVVNIDSPEDRAIVGNAYPDFSLGWSSNLQYKQFYLSFFVRGVFGHSLLNYERVFFESWQPLLSGRNILRSTLDNPDYTGLRRYDSRFVEDASYVKLDNVTVGYNFRLGGANLLRVSLIGQNLFTITDYSGYSPEQPFSGFNTSIGTSGAGNMNYYPYTRTFTLNLNYKF